MRLMFNVLLFCVCVCLSIRAQDVPPEVLRQRELKWLEMLKDWDKWISKRFKKVKETFINAAFYCRNLLAAEYTTAQQFVPGYRSAFFTFNSALLKNNDNFSTMKTRKQSQTLLDFEFVTVFPGKLCTLSASSQEAFPKQSFQIPGFRIRNAGMHVNLF